MQTKTVRFVQEIRKIQLHCHLQTRITNSVFTYACREFIVLTLNVACYVPNLHGSFRYTNNLCTNLKNVFVHLLIRLHCSCSSACTCDRLLNIRLVHEAVLATIKLILHIFICTPQVKSYLHRDSFFIK